MYGFTLLPFPPPLLLDQEAAEARAALVKVEAQAAIDEKVRDACCCWRVLDKAVDVVHGARQPTSASGKCTA